MARRPPPPPVSDVTLSELRPGLVARSLDTSGDFAGSDFYIHKVGKSAERPKAYAIWADGGMGWYTLEELNIDRASIRPRHDFDPDYIGLLD